MKKRNNKRKEEMKKKKGEKKKEEKKKKKKLRTTSNIGEREVKRGERRGLFPGGSEARLIRLSLSPFLSVPHRVVVLFSRR